MDVKKAQSAVNSVKKNADQAAKEVKKSAGQAAKEVKKGADQVAKEVKTSVKAAESGSGNMRNEAFKKVVALIPNQVNNATVVTAFEMMRKEQKLLKKSFDDHLKINESAFLKHADVVKKNKGYVEDQNAYTDMKYGEATMQYSGCEIFATFNALFNLTGKNPVSLPKLISTYEGDGMVLSGKFGTSPKAIADFFEKQGFKTTFTTEEKEFDTVAKNNDSMILTMYNDKNDISQEVHTVNISKENGKLTAHNVYCNGKVVGPYASVSEVIKNINGGKAKGISLVGVKKK